MWAVPRLWVHIAGDYICLDMLCCVCSDVGLYLMFLQGQTVLVENMGETIDAVLTPLITRKTFKKVCLACCLPLRTGRVRMTVRCLAAAAQRLNPHDAWLYCRVVRSTSSWVTPRLSTTRISASSCTPSCPAPTTHPRSRRVGCCVADQLARTAAFVAANVAVAAACGHYPSLQPC